MSEQLNLLAEERVVPIALHAEMQRSYLEYAMSVIVGRALPDVRDGLKPVHRRVMYAMYELGLSPDRPFRKCARVVGDVLGKYHPHGDQSVYDALVRLVQDFSTRYPLLAGHGNFGSIDNDPPAAMRYTETRLAPIGMDAMLADVGNATVDFSPNFDNSQEEPIVLPAQLPILLLNGCTGIAVGMATNIPPHNLGESIDGAIALIDRPDIADADLWALIPGPDFPTGGEIVSTEGILDAYRTGRGTIPIRGVTHVELAGSQEKTAKYKKRRDRIIVTELPFQVNKAGWIEKVAELVNAGKIEGISDLRDESDREGMRVVIELKRDAEPPAVLAQLYRQTALQSNFGAIFLAIVDGQPRQLSLREVLEEFLRFREETLTRRYRYELEKKEGRSEVVNGLLLALENLDDIIDILRRSRDGSSAKVAFKGQFNLSDPQADAILSMPLRRLTGLEKEQLMEESAELAKEIQRLRILLDDRTELLKALKKELRSLKKKFGDQRRTKIVDPISLSKRAKALPVKAIRESSRAKSKVLETPQLELLKEGDSIESDDNSSGGETIDAVTTVVTSPDSASKAPIAALQTIIPISIPLTPEIELEFTHANTVRRWYDETKELDPTYLTTARGVFKSERTFVCVTSDGKAYPVAIKDIPPTKSNEPGTKIDRLVSALSNGEAETVSHLFLTDRVVDRYLLVITAQAKAKRLPIIELSNLGSRGLSLIKLKDGDRLVHATRTAKEPELIICVSSGRMVRLSMTEENVPIVGRASQGNRLLQIGVREDIVDLAAVDTADEVAIFSAAGYVKRIAVMSLRLVPTNSVGVAAMQFTSKEDRIVAMCRCQGVRSFTALTSKGETIEIPFSRLGTHTREGGGDRAIELDAETTIVAIVPKY
jgi:DNA gyrase subunit A